jgi:hypothetical protein
MGQPARLRLNAFSDAGPVSGALERGGLPWALQQVVQPAPTLMFPPKEVDLQRWDDPAVGWGLILPDRTSLTTSRLATADDAPEPIRTLVRQRGNAPVYRYQRGDTAFSLLRDYRTNAPVPVNGAPRGTGEGALPYYLLIYGTPDEIPWRLQYVLNANRCVGRLDLDGDALANYVRGLLAPAPSARRDPASVVWAVDHGTGPDGEEDITVLLRHSIAEKVSERLFQDPDLGRVTTYCDGLRKAGRTQDLIAALCDRRPAMVVSTSHGLTGPIARPDEMSAQLGFPVDQDRSPVRPEQLLEAWKPDGAIWYAHACCSAGVDATTLFDKLFAKGSEADRILTALTKLGSRTAPLPRALLGAADPLRAFIGHVEPTFDFTLSHVLTQQPLTGLLVDALYPRICRGEPVGYAFRDWYGRIAGLYNEYISAAQSFDKGGNTADLLLAAQLAARDIQSTVILGDPAAVFVGATS